MLNPTPTLALFGTIGWQELMILAILGLLIFGRRLPEVGRSLGKGIVEFKRGLKDIGDEIEEESNKPAPRRAAMSGGGGGTLPEGSTTFRAPVNAEGEDVRVSREQRTENRE